MASASITTTIEDEDELSEAFAKSWAVCYEEIEKQQAELQGKADLKESMDDFKDMAEEPVETEATPTCPIHHVKAVYRPSGVSKKTGKPYPGFYSCPERGPSKNLNNAENC